MTAPNTPPTAPLPTPPIADPKPSPSAPTPPTGGGDPTPTATDPTGTDAPDPADVPEWGADFDPARAWQTIKHLRGKTKETEAQLAAERAKVAAHEREKMTAAEKLQADLDAVQRERDELRQAAADAAARTAFDTAAAAADIRTDALATAFDIARKVASSDESGSMLLDSALFDRIKAEHPYLVATATPQAAPPRVTFGAASSQGLGGSPTNLTPEQVAFAQKAGIDLEDFAKHSVRPS